MKVLVAEEDIAFRTALEGMLTQWGYEVNVAGDGVEALRALEKDDAPKLAILGRKLPGRDGIGICREVRKWVGRPYIYIIILAEEDGKQDVLESLNDGADEHLTKPLDGHELKPYLNAAQRILDLQDKLIAAREALWHQATRDSLTGLWNHGAILDTLKRELERSQRNGSAVGVIMADLDHFKRINDTYGHQAGDQVLVQVARRLETALRPYDTVGRYGGEEFLIVLPGCDTPSLLMSAERLRKGIGGKAMVIDDRPIPVTMSLGLCSNHEPYVADGEALLRAADTALYRAKDTGRNRIERATAEDVLGRMSG